MKGKRVDSNHGTIRDGLRELGYQVYDSSAFGKGFPDLVVALKTKHKAAVFLEIKTEKGKTNKTQNMFYETHDRMPCFVVRDIEEALEVLYKMEGLLT